MQRATVKMTQCSVVWTGMLVKSQSRIKRDRFHSLLYEFKVFKIDILGVLQ